MVDSGASSNAELLALQRIDEAATQLQQQGNYLGALECLERGLVLRQHFFGAESDEVWTACKSVAEMCNLLAMTYLQQQDYAVVLELLKKAEILTERDEAGRAVTLNNLACYYRRQGKLHAALTHLQKALKIEAALQKVENAADTHLNMCAVLSQLGDHPAALEHAQSALILLQEELFAQETTPLAEKADRVAVLAIAYHNIGVEQEFLKKLADAANSYRKGISIAEQHLGDAHGIAITLRNSLLAVKRAQGMHRQRARPGASRAKEGTQKPLRQKGAASRKATGRSGTSGLGSATSASSSRMQGSTVPTLGADPSTVSLEQQRAAYELEQQQPRALRRGAGEGTAAAVEQLPSMELAQMISPRPAETPGPEGEETTAVTDTQKADTVPFPQFTSSSTCALKRVLTPELHETLLAARSSAGSDLTCVIRSGVALPSDGIGAFAADADCFSDGSFGGLLKPLLSDLHGGAFVPGSTTVARCLDASKLQVPVASPLDPATVSQVSFVVTRCVNDIAFVPQITGMERIQLEEKLQSAVATLTDDLAGSYCPVDALMKIDPQAAAGLKGDKYWAAAGCDRDWPAGRGLFTSSDQQLKVELNTTEHLVLRLDQDGSDIQGAFDRVCRTIRALEAKFDFAFDAEIGYLASSLHNVGIALRCMVVMKLPLTSKEAAFNELTANYNLKAIATGDDGTITLMNRSVFGDSELKAVQNVIDGAAFFCQMEATLRADDGSDPADA